MITIHSIFIGQSQTITDAQGTWRSSIFRWPVSGPIALGLRGLDGDQVTDAKHHGSSDQAVCCHFLTHYDHWNAFYRLEGDSALGAGSVGENWTLEPGDESIVCVGDVFQVGAARVQVTGPRIPCSKQERRLGLPGFQQQSLQSLRTGFYLRVLTPGMVQAGDTLTPEARPHPDLTLQVVNVCAHRQLDAELARRLIATPELAESWRGLLQRRLY